jgi:hypothetical protein
MTDRPRTHENFLGLPDGPCSVVVFDADGRASVCGIYGEAVVGSTSGPDSRSIVHYVCLRHGGSSSRDGQGQP